MGDWADMYDHWFDGPEEEEEPLEVRYNQIVHQTEKATLFETAKGQFWAPKSLCELHEARGIKTVFLPGWFEIKYLTK